LAGLLLIALGAETAVNTITRYFSDILPLPAVIFQAGTIVFALLIATVVLTVLFRFLPNTKLALKDVALGGFLSSVFFTIGNYALGFYLGRTSPGSVFGAAGSFAVIMVWIYYSSIVVLFGVEITRANWERRHGMSRHEYLIGGGGRKVRARPLPGGKAAKRPGRGKAGPPDEGARD
jgi:membrane protein